MIVTCPACEAQYVLPDDAVGAKGRRVKCTSCAYTWLQAPENTGEEEFVAAPEIATEADWAEVARTRALTTRPQPTPVVANMSTAKVIGAGVGIGLVLAVITIGFMIFIRNSVTAGMPELALLFETVGLPVDAPGKGFDIQEVKAEPVTKDGAQLLKLNGKLVNTLDQEKTLPQLLVRVSGANGWLKDWPIDLYDKLMQPKESIGFEYLLDKMPEGAQDVVVRFAE